MSMIHSNGITTFKPKTGFKYPAYWAAYKEHDRIHWTVENINLAKDVQDFKNADQREKDYITNVMKLFTQNEILVGAGYDTCLKIFKPVEIKAWLANANAREYTHIEAYSLFTETIGLGDSVYSDFLDIPVMSSKTKYLDKARVKKYEEYKAMGLSNAEVDKEYRRDIARMLAVYGGGAEGIALYAQFASLLKFQFLNKYPGLADINIYSIKEEALHNTVNSMLFRDFISENTDIWDDELKFDIYEAIREMVAYEKDLIDYLDPPHMEKTDLKKYVEYCADNALLELGMKANYNVTKNPLPYMDDVVGSIQADFFSTRVTEYTKSVQGNWGDIKFENWSSNDS